MKLSSTEKTIINGMARAFFVTAWADKQQEKGRTFPGEELMDVAPSTPRYARDFALMYAGRLGSLLVHLNNAAWADVLESEKLTTADVPYRFKRPDLEEKAEALKTDEYARDFGHYLAMQAMGSGVSWFDDHAQFEINIQHTEAHL